MSIPVSCTTWHLHIDIRAGTCIETVSAKIQAPVSQSVSQCSIFLPDQYKARHTVKEEEEGRLSKRRAGFSTS